MTDQQVFYRIIWVLVLACSPAWLAGCGGSSSQTSDQSLVQVDKTSEPDQEASSPSSSAPELTPVQINTVTIDFTDPEGWHYSGEFGLPASYTFAKDISESPPGKAVLLREVEPGTGSSELANDNEGRMGPPHDFDIAIVFGLDGLGLSEAGIGGERCGFRAGSMEFSPYESWIECSGNSGNGRIFEAEESVVDDYISVLSTVEPTIRFDLSTQPYDNCAAVYLMPTGERAGSNDYQTGQCGDFTAVRTVHDVEQDTFTAYLVRGSQLSNEQARCVTDHLYDQLDQDEINDLFVANSGAGTAPKSRSVLDHAVESCTS